MNSWSEIKAALIAAARPTHPWEPTIRVLIDEDGIILEAQKGQALKRSIVTWECLEEALFPELVLDNIRYHSSTDVAELFEERNRSS